MKEKLERAKDEKEKKMDIGTQRPGEAKGSPRSKHDLSQVRPEGWLRKSQGRVKAKEEVREVESSMKEKKEGTKYPHVFTASSLATRPRSARR